MIWRSQFLRAIWGANMERSDWLLLALSEAFSAQDVPGYGLDRAKLMKSLFLLGREQPQQVEPNFYDFRPYLYGPFDSRVYSDVSKLVDRGLVAVSPGPTYSVTAAGYAEGQRLAGLAPRSALDYLRAVVRWIKPLSFRQLIQAIYDRYPDTKTNSVFR
jgi:hypothetical protein